MLTRKLWLVRVLSFTQVHVEGGLGRIIRISRVNVGPVKPHREKTKRDACGILENLNFGGE